METLAAPTHAAQRHDCYAGIHKALRLALCRTLAQVGSADPQDAPQVIAAARAVMDLMALSEGHMEKEDTYMHPLMEAACPGSTQDAAEAHEHHLQAITQLRQLAQATAEAAPAERATALAQLYQALAAFMAVDLAHMQHEETAHNALLWSHYDDAELLAVEQRIVASIPPDMSLRLLRWFMPAFNAPERLRMLSGMRAGAPAPVFQAAISVARDSLPSADFAKLARQLDMAVAPVVPGLVSEARG